MPLPLKFDSEPPEAVTSANAKFDDDSLNVKLMVADSPTVNELSFDAMLIVGAESRLPSML